MGANKKLGLMTLFEAAKQGRKGDLEDLLGRVRPRVRRYLVGQLQSHPATEALAEELTQDVLVRIARSVEDCRATNERQLLSWVRTIARRRVIDRYRRREREMDRRVWDVDPRLEGEVLLESLVDDDRDLSAKEVSRIDRILGAFLWEAQAELSEGTQRVLRRRLLYGETWPQVGEEVGTTAAGAKRRYQRAQDRLRREVLDRIRELPPDRRDSLLERLEVTPET